MASTFDQRMRHLAREVGDGELVGKVLVDQRYAHTQHEDLWPTGQPGVAIPKNLDHPMGGGAKYLEGPLYENVGRYMRRLAREAITENGSDLAEGMIRVVEDLSDEVHANAPRFEHDLRNSAAPTVTDENRVVYDRPPRQRRLTDEELRAKSYRYSDKYGTDHPYGNLWRMGIT